MDTLLEVVNRKSVPGLWQEGDNIPWHRPEFSQRMLAEHLSQEHDAASRRFLKIDAQVEWIHSEVLRGKPTRILDLCCGPGLYTSRLAALGHDCMGIDFSPAAIAYANEQASAEQLPCRYVQEDVRCADFGDGYELVMMIFGQLNVFRPAAARALLLKAKQALDAGGTLLLEVHTLTAVECMGKSGTSWCSTQSGLFSSRPHLVLEEHFWHAESKAATTRFYVVDALTGDVTAHAMTIQGYTDEQHASLLVEAGFTEVSLLPSLVGVEDPEASDFLCLVGRNCRV